MHVQVEPLQDSLQQSHICERVQRTAAIVPDVKARVTFPLGATEEVTPSPGPLRGLLFAIVIIGRVFTVI